MNHVASADHQASWVFCTFRCLVRAAYREARHLGPLGDAQAKCRVADGPFAGAAELCRRDRPRLKSLDLWERASAATTPTDVLAPYIAATGLRPESLPDVFRLHGWAGGYGGEKWAVIAQSLLDLRDALEAGDPQAAEQIAARVETLRHNSGPLVPMTARELAAWQPNSWAREKWPLRCR